MSTPTPQQFAELLNAQSAQLSSLESSLILATSKIDDLGHALDTMWLLVCAYLVFIMQLGFALLEAGAVRAINTKNILMQNTLDTLISIVMFWLIGFGIANGTDNLGIGDMKLSALTDNTQYAPFLYLWAFANATTTIVSGAVTSRIKFSTYMASCVLLSGFTFPVVAYWTWGWGMFGTKNPKGWGVIDFAGGTVVHIVGGFSAFVGAWIVGPRSDRWVINEKGVLEDHKSSGHSIVLGTIGTFLLWFGWFGFNSGSTFALSNGQYLVASTAAINSLIATGASGLAITIWFIYHHKTHDLAELLNGMLCGLVSITPCCATVEPWGSVIIGVLSIPVYRFGIKIANWLRVDDVVDTFPVHACCGVYGSLMAGLLSTQANIDMAYGPGRINYNVGVQFGKQLVACLTCIVFSSGMQAILFFSLKYTVGIRVSEADERVGLDFKYHAGYAYPDFNQRVKKAHEQIAMEAELANQVRKALQAGKGNRFKEAVNLTSSPFDATQAQLNDRRGARDSSNDNKGGGKGGGKSKIGGGNGSGAIMSGTGQHRNNSTLTRTGTVPNARKAQQSPQPNININVIQINNHKHEGGSADFQFPPNSPPSHPQPASAIPARVRATYESQSPANGSTNASPNFDYTSTHNHATAPSIDGLHEFNINQRENNNQDELVVTPMEHENEGSMPNQVN